MCVVDVITAVFTVSVTVLIWLLIVGLVYEFLKHRKRGG